LTERERERERHTQRDRERKRERERERAQVSNSNFLRQKVSLIFPAKTVTLKADGLFKAEHLAS